MSLNKFIETINKPLEKLISGIKVFGLAEPISRTQGAVTEIIPGIVGNDGEIKYVGPDDLQTVIVYHKVSGIVTRLTNTLPGYGREFNGLQNAYGLSMIVWLDRKKTNLRPDELFLYIQANLTGKIDQEPYNQVLVNINSVILNGQQVYDSEFKGVENKLPANQTLMQINYTIESAFRVKCFEKCPEEC